MILNPQHHRARFLDVPAHVSTHDGWHFRNLRSFAYLSKDGHVHVIPVHDDSDGASTPRFIWGIVAPFGKHWLPALMHDHLYRRTKMEKSKCDNLFLEAMEANGVSWGWRHVIWLGVVIGGHWAFRADRKSPQS